MGWIILFGAAFMEVVGVVGLKFFSVKKNLLSFTIFIGGFALSYLFLYKSLEFLHMSIAYSVWAGVGTAGAVLINIILFNESKNAFRLFGVFLVIVGVVGLKLTA